MRFGIHTIWGFSLALAACGEVVLPGGQSEEATQTETPSAEQADTTAISEAPPARAPRSLTADVVFKAIGPDAPRFAKPQAYETGRAEGERPPARIFNGFIEDARPGGRTQGIRFDVGSDWETRASGKRIRVSFLAKSSSGGPDTFSAAYSTHKDGSSGWRELAIDGDYKIVSFNYRVPEVTEAGEEIVSILPDPTNDGSGVIIREIGLSVLEES